jgi:hypothetical protein
MALSDVPEMIADASRNDFAATCVHLAERWLQDHPDDLWVIHKYAEMLYMLTRYDDAVRVYTDAIDEFEDHRWGIYNALGHLYRYRGWFPEAEKWYRKATEEDPDEATGFIFLGSIQARQGHLKEAEATHRKATMCPEGCIDEAFHNLGLVLRTGETALYMAVQERNEPIIAALVAAGANPDAPNCWGLTPRVWASRDGAAYFDQVPPRDTPLPPARIQNAEHLADHYHPGFKIPDREERETMQVGQAVDLYVYGPKAEGKQDTVKVRITARSGLRPQVRYIAAVETLIEHPLTARHDGGGVRAGEHCVCVYAPTRQKEVA